jgi:phosphohistidine phosphatase
MLKLGLAFDSILTSPYVRARQTAEIVAKTFQAEKRLKISEHLACEGSPKKLIQELKTLKAQDLLIVGHEPYLSGLISLLISGRSDLDINLKKAGLCRLSIDSLKYGRCARLDWLLTPNQLT